MTQSTQVTHLRCEYLTDPLGIDETAPRLSWLLESSRRGARQVAYRIEVASTSAMLASREADLWDSGRIESDATSQIIYAGLQLRSRMVCYWQVTVWDERAGEGGGVTSKPAFWTMGLLEHSDWQARWITHDEETIRRDPEARESTPKQPGTPPLLRKEFAVSSQVRRATVYVTARGLADVYLNGQRVTADQFVPEWTDYNHRLHYRTFAVTDLIRAGDNALGAILGDGWWSGFIGWQETRGQYGTLENSLRMQLEIEFADGTRQVITSDGSWKCETGPILASDFMLGETYDSRRERDGWDSPGFDDSKWLAVREVSAPHVHIPHFGFSNNQAGDHDEELALVAQRSEPVRVVERITPVSVTEVAPGKFIYDLGQNIAGWVECTVSALAGTQIQLRHAERLNPDGTLYTENLRRADATDRYTCRGGGEETWHPRFTFHGFQYIELAGLEEPIPLEDICGCVVMSATPPAGEFACSNELVNRLWKNALWGQKGNFLSVPTDCPQRDERLGWMGDAQVFIRTATYNMDVAAFFTKWMQDVVDSQDCVGIFPDVAPRLREGDNFVGLDGLGGGAAWADAGIIVPWTIWRVYGDTRVIEKHWSAMVRWMDWLEHTNPSCIRENKLNNNYGDWLCIPSDREFRTHSEMKTLLATAFWADDAAKMASMAEALGNTNEAGRFRERFERVREAWQKRWLLDDGRLAVEQQTAYLLALASELLPEEVRSQAAEHLVENIAALDWHLSTGFVGIRHLNPILTLWGHPEVAYRLLLTDTYPSWLYPVLHGATTIWERWNGWTAEDGFFNPEMNSFNHYSLGSVSEWLYRHVAGIELDPAEPAFKKILINPFPDPQLEHAGASYESIHGRVESRWSRAANSVRLEIVVPPNTSAEVHVPCAENAPVLEGGRPVSKSAEVRFLRHDGRAAIFLVPAGRYEFQSHSEC